MLTCSLQIALSWSRMCRAFCSILGRCNLSSGSREIFESRFFLPPQIEHFLVNCILEICCICNGCIVGLCKMQDHYSHRLHLFGFDNLLYDICHGGRGRLVKCWIITHIVMLFVCLSSSASPYDLMTSVRHM